MASDEILLEVEESMSHAVEYLRTELRGIRTGRASPALVDHIKVDYYGSPTDLRALATISTPEPTQILIKPFDPGSVKDIERAIQASPLGVTPSSDGKLIRLNIPPLSGERRKQLSAQVKKMAEAAKVTVRNARRDANKAIDTEEKASSITEDDSRKAKDEVQELTKKHEQQVDEVSASKMKEIEET